MATDTEAFAATEAGAAPEPAPWYRLDANDVAARLATDPRAGLGAAAAAERLARYGPNAIKEAARRSRLGMLVAQFTDFMILILIAAAAVSGIIGDLKDTVFIVGIVIVNAAIGFAQEYRAERAIEALKRLAAPHAVVIRDGRPQPLTAKAVVPGDLVLLEAGNAVPADLRIVEVADLRLGEAALTGESLPVDKKVDPLDEDAVPLGDRRNMAFKGTVVLYGRGSGIAVATGMETELGRIAGMLRAPSETRTPLQDRLAVLGRQLAIAALAICAIVFVVGLLRGVAPMLMLLTALSLAVAAIPEALPAVVTVLLALGARRMARAQALIRRLPAVETLGSVTVICSDKTGTLTMNEMRAEEAFVAGVRVALGALDAARRPVTDLMRAMALCNDVARDAEGTPIGDPTEIALWQAAAAAGFDKAALAQEAPRIAEVPFDSERKRMTTLHREAGRVVAYTKGAPETVLERCALLATPDGDLPLDRDALAEAAERMAADGRRVLAVACRSFDAAPAAVTAGRIERDLTLLGLIGLRDPPRSEARESVAACLTAGIAPVMITGDHPATARAVARELGMLGADGAVMTGVELGRLSDDELRQRVRETRVYARVDPAQKIRIVEALQGSGEVVAMTGDGVNDAPALSRADIGVAMGRIGTDVARESASLVLLDDNFATIVAAVREGRRIYDNIRKFVRYTVTSNSAEIWVVLLAPFLGLPIPLLPIQILWINLVTDALPGLALAAEPAERNVMRRPPRPKQEGVFGQGMLAYVVWVGLFMGAITLLTQAIGVSYRLDHWQTMVFTVLTLAQMGQIMAIRSEQDSLFRQGLMSNKPLLGAVALTFGLQLLVIYAPPLNPIFRTQPLSAAELAGCLLASAAVFGVVELAKWWQRARRLRGADQVAAG